MASVFGLFIIVRVQIDVVDYYVICRSQIDSETTRFGWDEEYRNGLVLVEQIDQFLPAKFILNVF